MTLRQFAREQAVRVRHDPLPTVAWGAAHRLWDGALRRVPVRLDMGDPEPIWAREDWDVLVILDACRADLLNAACGEGWCDWLPNAAGALTSVGACSPEWIDATFAPEHRDVAATTGYVTANPFSSVDPYGEWPNIPIEEGRDVGYLDEVWRRNRDCGVEGVTHMDPREVTDAAISAWRRRGEVGIDRLVVHYMQPHAPFRSRPEWFDTGDDSDEWWMENDDVSGKNIWARLRDGEVGHRAVWDAYRENLRWVLEDVALLRENCDADMVLSADHGNALGEWGVYGHPPGVPVAAVREVPWAPVEARDEETYAPEAPDPEGNDADVREHLEALGYA